jgi:hypothetical protein
VSLKKQDRVAITRIIRSDIRLIQALRRRRYSHVTYQVAITLGAHLRHQAGTGWEHGYPRRFVAALIGMFILCILVLICYSRAEQFVTMPGRSGTSILIRLAAFILLAIGVQIMWNGLSSGMPSIFSSAEPQT